MLGISYLYPSRNRAIELFAHITLCDAHGVKKPRLFISSQIEYRHVHHNHSFTHIIPSPMSTLLYPPPYNESNEKTDASRTLNESINVKNRWWCQITALLSMPDACTSACKSHANKLNCSNFISVHKNASWTTI